MKYIILFTISILLVFSGYNAFKLHLSYKELKRNKEDLAEINKINYGLFNIQHWKKEALLVFENRISEFEISNQAYDQVVIELEKYLRSLNREYIESGKIFENIFAEAEKNEKINKVFLKLIKENTGVQVKLLDIPKYIPNLAIQLANELKKQEPQLRDIMRAELKKIIKDDDLKAYIDPRQIIYDKYKTTDLAMTNELLIDKIAAQEPQIERLIQWIYSGLLFSFVFSWTFISVVGFKVSITLITINSVVLLLLGISLPMIDIEAVLNSFTINLLGSEVGFERQYMYYQSKSILDVTETLIKARGLDIKIVGVMILFFSIVFPLVKLLLSTAYLYSSKIANNRVIQNIIFYLGKWSMADVFVVAMFMAYIGFYGIISSQLNAIANNEGGFAVETINNSKLSPGALFFTTYCVFSIIIGIMINRHNIRITEI